VPLVRPPFEVVQGVELFAPGFWAAFVHHINDAAGSVTGPVTVSSWYRNPTDNERVGGNKDSQHLLGAAVDLVASRPSELYQELTRRGFVVVNEGDHLHVQAWPAGVARRAGLLDYFGY
jgi:hypothetical protein